MLLVTKKNFKLLSKNFYTSVNCELGTVSQDLYYSSIMI